MLKKVTGTRLCGLTLVLLLGACQAGEDQPAQGGKTESGIEMIAGPAGKSSVEEHSSEAVVGPDEAFFAAQYLEQFFRYSKEHKKPDLSSKLSLASTNERVSAFDFDANFLESRLQLMAQALLRLGDQDQDEALSEAEFQALQLKPEIFGVGGESLGHSYSREVFLQIAGEGGNLGIEEIKSLLRSLGPSLKAFVQQKSDKEQRLLIIRAWDKVLKAYDKDQDGSISSAEQRALRQERSRILAGLQG